MKFTIFRQRPQISSLVSQISDRSRFSKLVFYGISVLKHQV
jgi:hypothetical protein